MADEPGDLVLSTFATIVDKVKSTRPVQTNGKGLTVGIVYSPLVLGLMVDPRDYMNPWTPTGGATLADALAAEKAAADAGTTVPVPSEDPGAEPTGLSAAQRSMLALRAAYNTSQLVDSMLMVTQDGSYLGYPTERKVSFAWEGILKGMQPGAVSALSPEIKARIDTAKKVLYELDGDGNIIGKSRRYKAYVEAAEKYADAKFNFDEARREAMSNPAAASAWPTGKGPVMQRKVDQAFSDWRTLGAEDIEAALATLEAVGVNIDAAMIAKARRVWEAWQLALSGVATPTAFASISPASWCDPNRDDIGWQRLSLKLSESRSKAQSATAESYKKYRNSRTRSTEGGGGGSFLGFGASAKGGSRSSAMNWGDGSNSWSQSGFKNDAKGMSIELDYGLCTIERPWLIGDLFYLRDWFLKDNKKGTISTGDVQGQALDQNKFLPMIPRQMLCVRNVKIRATQWNSDGESFKSAYNQAESATNSSGKFVSGGGGFSLGVLSIGGSASHSSTTDTSSASGSAGMRASSSFGWRFKDETLEIRGTQIIAWLSEIVPPCPPLDDPQVG